MKKVYATTNAPAAIGPYSQAVQAGDFDMYPVSFPSTRLRENLQGQTLRARPGSLWLTSKRFWKVKA